MKIIQIKVNQNLPAITQCNDLLSDLRDVLKARAKAKQRSFADVRNTLKVNEYFKAHFYSKYKTDILAVRSLKQMYKLLTAIQLEETAGQSGRAIVDQMFAEKEEQYKNKLENLYLSYANDFISIAAFTEYHGIESEVIAHSIITRGRVIHQSRNPTARNWFTLNQTSKNRNLWDLRLLAEKSA